MTHSQRCNDCGYRIQRGEVAHLRDGAVLCGWCVKKYDLGLFDLQFCGCCHQVIADDEPKFLPDETVACAACFERREAIPLLEVDEDGNVQPVDAEKWELASDIADTWLSRSDNCENGNQKAG